MNLPIRTYLSLLTLTGFLFLSGGCATAPLTAQATSEMRNDVKNDVDNRIAFVTELERRLEHVESSAQFVSVMQFLNTSIQSHRARAKLMLARYPELRWAKRVPDYPVAVRPEMVRLEKFFQEKKYVFASLNASLIRYGSQPSVMKALQQMAPGAPTK